MFTVSFPDKNNPQNIITTGYNNQLNVLTPPPYFYFIWKKKLKNGLFLFCMFLSYICIPLFYADDARLVYTAGRIVFHDAMP